MDKENSLIVHRPEKTPGVMCLGEALRSREKKGGRRDLRECGKALDSIIKIWDLGFHRWSRG